MNFSSINNSCLKNGFKLETNLSEVRGSGFNVLMESLNLCSILKPNRRIIERIMYHHNSVFRNPESIKEIMRKEDPVINAFAKLGNSDMDCNIRWLINTLNFLGEMVPLRDIVATGPPVIHYISTSATKQVKPGGKISFKIHTISEARMQWWKHNDSKTEIIVDHIRVPEYSSEIVNYQTKSSDKGFIYLDISCCGGYRQISPWIYVGEEITNKDRLEYIGLNNIESLYIDSANESSTINIIPSRESDGIKRVALLIGIMNYKSYNNSLSDLKAPESDIHNLERVLLQMGFTVLCFSDLNERELRKILKQFSNTCVEKNCYVFCYFAGHGHSSKKVDYLQLTRGKISESDILNIVIEKDPKLLVSIFDMCRSDNSEATDDAKLPEANIPISKNLILINSTLPRMDAYERSMGVENISLIMKPLCENLSLFGCKQSTNMVLTNFLNSCENICQRPNMVGIGLRDRIGIDIIIPRIQPKIYWLDEPENWAIMSCITIDFRTFHNFLNIFIDTKQNESIVKTTVEIQNEVVDYSKPINLFRYREELRERNSIIINFSVLQKLATMVKSKYSIEVQFPDVLIPFLLLE